jgi:hypothetical protein
MSPRGHAGPSGRPGCAHEPHTRLLGAAKAPLTRADPPGEVHRGGTGWPASTGHEPQGLAGDAPRAPEAALARLPPRGLWGGTLRRRGAAVVRCLPALAAPGGARPAASSPSASATPAGRWTSLGHAGERRAPDGTALSTAGGGPSAGGGWPTPWRPGPGSCAPAMPDATVWRLAVRAARLGGRVEKRAHTPSRREAARDAACPPLPGLANRPVAFEYP